jgi:uncharacterized protein YdcH (DUF465 family)
MVNFEEQIKELKYNNSVFQNNFEQVLKLNKELAKENKVFKKRIIQLETKVSKLESQLEKHNVKPNQPSGSKPDYEKEISKSSK